MHWLPIWHFYGNFWVFLSICGFWKGKWLFASPRPYRPAGAERQKEYDKSKGVFRIRILSKTETKVLKLKAKGIPDNSMDYLVKLFLFRHSAERSLAQASSWPGLPDLASKLNLAWQLGTWKNICYLTNLSSFEIHFSWYWHL